MMLFARSEYSGKPRKEKPASKPAGAPVKKEGFRLTEKQQEAIKLLAGSATHCMLFGGSRSGKTFLLCLAVAVRAVKAPGSRHAIFRFRFNHVKTSIILDTWPKVMALRFPGMPYRIDKTDWYCEFPNGSQVWFGGLDDKERTEKILGQEHVTIYLNECSQISWEAREMVLTRLAQLVMVKVKGVPEEPLQPRMFYDCNPPKKSHWTYKTFVRKINLETRKSLDNPRDYVAMQINPRDNTDNLSPGYLTTLQALSARGRKRFLDGEFADDTNNALFDESWFDTWRVTDHGDLPEFVRVVVPVDPSGSGDVDNADNDAIGIAVCALGTDGIGYLLEDLTVKAGPATWGKVATTAYERHEANGIVGEMNYGGAMVEHVIQTARPHTPFIPVTASRGKHVRAEPISALYEQGKIRHVGHYPELEEELAAFTVNGYVGPNSPNRADAAVWGFTELFSGIVAPKGNKKFTREISGGGSRWAN